MWLVLTALRRPVTILVAVLTVALASILAVRQWKGRSGPGSASLDPDDPSSIYYDPS